MSRLVVVSVRVGLLAGLLVVWELAARALWIDPFHFSQPSAVATQIVDWVRDGAVFRHLWVTLLETVLGFLLGAGLGIAVGLAFGFSRTLTDILEPVLVVLNALPRIVLAPLFVLWFGLGLLSKVVMAASLVFFVVFFATFSGITEVDRTIVDNARVLGASRRDLARHVLMPSALAWIFNSLRASVGFALMGAVVGEYLGASEGMGWLIYFEESMFRSTGVMAGLTILLVLVAMVDTAMKALERRLTPWRVRT